MFTTHLHKIDVFHELSSMNGSGGWPFKDGTSDQKEDNFGIIKGANIPGIGFLLNMIASGSIDPNSTETNSAAMLLIESIRKEQREYWRKYG